MKRKYFISNYYWFSKHKTWDGKNEEIKEFGLKELTWEYIADYLWQTEKIRRDEDNDDIVRYELKDLSIETFNKIEVGDYVLFITPPFLEERKGFFGIVGIGVIRQVFIESMRVMINKELINSYEVGIADLNVNPDTITMLEITNETYIEFLFDGTIQREKQLREYRVKCRLGQND